MSIDRICKICGVTFEAKNARFDLCSDVCVKKAHCLVSKKLYYKDVNKSRLIIKKSQAKHKIKRNAEVNKYREAHKDYFSQKSKEWYWKNKEKANKNYKLWYLNNHERKMILNSKRRINFIFAGLLPDEETIRHRMNLFDGCCFCDSKVPLTLEHLTPVSKGGSNLKINLYGSCKRCNVSKSAKNWKEWFRKQEFYSPEREIQIENYSEKRNQNRGALSKKMICH